MRPLNLSLYAAAIFITWAVPHCSRAEPYLATRMGLKCVNCHVNPTGGGLRNDYGMVFATTILPAQPFSGEKPAWTGRVSDLLRIGGDLRGDGTWIKVPHQANQHDFNLDQARLYADLTLIPQRLGLYVDEQVAPGAAQTMEAYVRYGDIGNGLYLKGGKFYLPFGWRLQDNTAFVREVSGINMATPDSGLELGYESGKWSAQFDLTNGAANSGQSSGYETTAQLAWVESRWRGGVAGSFTRADAGNREAGGLFAGLRTGTIVWLGEADLVRDEGFPGGARKLLAALGEADWEVRRGHNVKLTGEFFDPDRNVSNDAQNRWSLLYEFTPIPFVQLRAGFRRYEGIPQNDLQNRREGFIELHGFF
jgi:hypothetical protein